MSVASGAGAAAAVRDLSPGDLDEIVRIDALHTGADKPEYWARVFRDFLGADRNGVRVGLAAHDGATVVGYLLGEVRAFEFGSEPCGWVFAVGVDTGQARRGIATTLLAECSRRFREAGVDRVRTMVRRDHVPVQAFFRANGFTAGRFVQLERELEELA